jgi:hypothetical protein
MVSGLYCGRKSSRVVAKVIVLLCTAVIFFAAGYFSAANGSCAEVHVLNTSVIKWKEAQNREVITGQEIYVSDGKNYSWPSNKDPANNQGIPFGGWIPARRKMKGISGAVLSDGMP